MEGNLRKSNIHLKKLLKRRIEGKATFEEVFADNFSKLKKDIDSQAESVLRVPRRVNRNKFTSRLIKIKK